MQFTPRAQADIQPQCPAMTICFEGCSKLVRFNLPERMPEEDLDVVDALLVGSTQPFSAC